MSEYKILRVKDTHMPTRTFDPAVPAHPLLANNHLEDDEDLDEGDFADLLAYLEFDGEEWDEDDDQDEDDDEDGEVDEEDEE
jgi:hypothetical protein